ncbi:MAG: M20/M25/M40 family metallo-hydrolase, partial [Gemmatimonadales bacterium]|nr:M20/M25/M40 family metallo-hydrolase [Gemmatimonadales bacterium]
RAMAEDRRKRQVWDRIDESWSDQVEFLRELVGHESVLGKEEGVQHDWGFTVPEDDAFAQAVARAHTEVTGRPAEYNHATAVTDARFWRVHLGLPATCYGPVGANLHGPDEWVDLESVKEVTKVIAAFVLDYCGVA